MKVPVSWLREYARFEATTDELVHRLSISTAEVNGVERRGVTGDLSLFKVGVVLEADKHPNADRLQLTKVDVGEGKPYQIVCGAWNFGAGAKVAVALPGATLPNGLTLERRKLRGELSAGMILVEDLEPCPRYIGRLFRDVQIAASPVWLRARLNAAGVRSISNVVDVTNYVM